MSKTNRDRSLFVAAGMILLTLLFSGAFLGKTASRQFDEQYQERLRSGLTTYGVVLNYTYDGFNNAVKALAADAAFLSAVEAADPRKLDKVLSEKAAQVGSDSLYLIDHQGVPVHSHLRPNFSGPDVSQCFAALGGMVVDGSMLYLTSAKKLVSANKVVGYVCGVLAVTAAAQSEPLANLLHGTPYLIYQGQNYFLDPSMADISSEQSANFGEMVRWSGNGRTFFGMSGALALGTDELGIGILVADDVYRQNIRWASVAIMFSLTVMLLMGLFALRTMVRQRRTQNKLNQAKEQALVTLSSIGDSVITTDAKGKITFINSAAEKLMQQDSGRILGSLWNDVLCLAPGAGDELKSVVKASLKSDEPVFSSDDTELLYGDKVVPVRYTAARISRFGAQSGSVIVLHDVSKERELRQELAWRANHDELTRLPNRSHFHEKVTSAISCVRQRHSGAALLFLDLDKFKIINDTCGHDAGDQLLIQVCDLFSRNIRVGDTLARLGGDEFGVVLNQIDVAGARAVAESLIETLKGFEFNYEGRVFKVGVSIGLTMLEHDSGDLAAAIRQADEACYAAKESGRNRCCLYSEVVGQAHPSDHTATAAGLR